MGPVAERRRNGGPGTRVGDGKYGLPYIATSDGPKRVDGYNPPALEMEQALGVYVIALFDGAVFLFPSHSENDNKLEAVGNGVLRRIPATSYEVISGGMDDGESASQAALRETREERKIIPEAHQFSNSLPAVVVTQRRASSKPKRFSVAGYTLQLNAEQAEILRQQRGVKEFSRERLAQLLLAGELELRPAAQAALMAYLASEQIT
jgi:8-oxo-dGTP pyrophosphatase MutT (NUDIX family)